MKIKGLTFFEVLVALSLLSIFVFSILGFVESLKKSAVDIKSKIVNNDYADVLFNVLENSSRSVVCFDPIFGAGIIGNSKYLSLLSHQIIPDRFLSSSKLISPELVKLTIVYDSGLCKISFSSSLEDSKNVLEFKNSFRCEKIRFRYFTGTWSDAFNSLNFKRLPSAIECSIWFEGSSPLVNPDRSRIFSIVDGVYE